MPTISRQVLVQNKDGFHARPATKFAHAASQFESEIRVKKGGEEPEEADGKSVINLLILAALQGTPLMIEAEGNDAEKAVETLAGLFDAKFGEDD